jgi:CHAT domain-containing protein
MSKKERPKIYQHTSGGGHELIHNNPSPKEALETISLEHREVIYYNNKEFQRIKQALTDYANMVEQLEVERNDYQTDLRWVIEQLENSKITAQQEVKYELRKELYNGFIADITKVLESKV